MTRYLKQTIINLKQTIKNFLFYITKLAASINIILFNVAWIKPAIIRNYNNSKSPISNKFLNHGTLIELVWTITPAFILVLIAFPSFKLLYLMDEITDPSMSVLADEPLCFSYQYKDFLKSDGDFVEFDSYLISEAELYQKALPNLEIINDRFNSILDILLKHLSEFNLIRTCNAMEIPNRNDLINDILINLKRLEFLEQDYKNSFNRGMMTLHNDIYDRTTKLDYKGLYSIIRRMNELPMPTMPSNNLFDDDPLQYWNNRIKFHDEKCQRVITSLNMYKQTINDSDLFSKNEHKGLNIRIKALKDKAVLYKTNINNTNKEILDNTKILQEIRRRHG